MISPGRVAFTVFGIDIMWYGVLIGLGFVIAALNAYRKANRYDLSQDTLLDLFLVIIPCAIVGARAYFVIFKWDQYRGDLGAILDFRSGGLAIHGGILLSVIGVYIYTRCKKTDFLKCADLLIAQVPFGQALGRWGNFFNEEAHGIETDLPWAQIIDGVGYHPTFLYESVWCLILFFVLNYILENKHKFEGQVLCLYMMLYSVERYFVEGLRTDSLMIGPLRQAQVISMAIFLAGVILYVVFRKRSRE